MKASCPQCGTTYRIDKKAIREAQGMARCFNCGRVFNALDRPDRDDSPPPSPAQVSDARSGTPADAETPLPFDIPDDLPALEAADEVALDVRDTLHPSGHRRAPWWQKLLVVLLLVALLAQIAWLRRDLWIHRPAAIQLCAWLDCEDTRQARPDLYQVVERDMQAVSGTPPALRLYLRFRNEAAFPQPLPDLQLSLLDSNGSLVARRTLRPDKYLPPDWSGPAIATPSEVITIELTMEDPGPRVRGFTFDFL